MRVFIYNNPIEQESISYPVLAIFVFQYYGQGEIKILKMPERHLSILENIINVPIDEIVRIMSHLTDDPRLLNLVLIGAQMSWCATNKDIKDICVGIGKRL